MYCHRLQKHRSTSSNSKIISLVYRMVAIYDRKIKYVAYISKLQSNHLNQGTQMRFCGKNSSALSKFLLKIFNTFTNSENLRFFFHVYIQRMWCDKWGARATEEKVKFLFTMFFQKIKQYLWLPCRYDVVLSSMQHYFNDRTLDGCQNDLV